MGAETGAAALTDGGSLFRPAQAPQALSPQFQGEERALERGEFYGQAPSSRREARAATCETGFLLASSATKPHGSTERHEWWGTPAAPGCRKLRFAVSFALALDED